MPSPDLLRIEADSIGYEQEKNLFTADGKVTINFADLTLSAERVTLDMSANRAVATGNVKLRSASDTLAGERMELDISRVTGTIYEARAFLQKNNLHLKARRLEKTGDDTYRAFGAKATTCDSEIPDWQIAGSELEVTIDGYGKLKGGEFLVRNVPILYLPYLIFPAKTTRQSGFLFPAISHSRDIHGLDLELPYFIALSENKDATLFLRFLEKSGPKIGLEYRYFLGDSSSGVFYGDYLQDRREISETRADKSRVWPAGAQRWSLYWQHETIFSPSLNLRLDWHRLSDTWYFRDFSARNYYLDNLAGRPEDKFKRISFVGNESLTQLISTARLVWKDELHYLNFQILHTDELNLQGNDTTLQKYPEITFGGFRRAFRGGALQYEWRGQLSYNHRELGQKGYVAEIKPFIYLPRTLGGVVSLVPSASFTGTIWRREDDLQPGSAKIEGRYLYNLELNASTQIARVFHLDGAKEEKMRHVIKPELTYRYTPEVEQGGRPDFVAQVPAENKVSYALTNLLTTRSRLPEGSVAYGDYLRLKLHQTFDITEANRDTASGAAERRPWGDLQVELDFKPQSWLSLAARNSYDFYLGHWRRANYELAITDGRGDKINLGYRYTRDLLEEMQLSLKAVINRELDLSYVHRVDLKEKRDLEKTLGLIYRKQCWQLELSYSVVPQDTRFLVNLSLYGLGSIGN